MKKNIFILIVLTMTLNVFAQRDRPSTGRDSDRTGSSSSSSGSSSSTVSSGASSSGNSWSNNDGGSSSSGGSYSGGGSYGDNYGGSSYGYYTPSYGVDYVNSARDRMRGRNTAPILQHRTTVGWNSPIDSGNTAAMSAYHTGRYRVRVHVSYNNFGSCHTRYYGMPRNYYSTVNRPFIYQNWVMYPSDFYYGNGYHCINGYPYYVYSGYRHRYSDRDKCNYDLVDLETNTVIQSYVDLNCNEAFDTCAAKRDQLNEDEDYERYTCVEKVDEDLANSSVGKIPAMINNLTAAQIKEITDFVGSKKPKQLFKIGLKEGYKNCSIQKVDRKSNDERCNYLVKVGDKSYPLTDGSVCSNSKNTKLEYYGCKSASQMENAGCLLSIAMLEGYCK